MADSGRKIDEPTFVGPSFGLWDINHREDEVWGAPPGFERSQEVGQKLLLHIKDELNLLAGLLLEGGHDFPDRLVLLGVLTPLPPDHEVGGAGAERRQDDR